MWNLTTTCLTRLLLSAKALTVVLLLAVIIRGATSATDGTTPLGLQPGAPAGTYSLSEFENINLFNGSLNFQLPLFGVAGRGGMSIPVLLPIAGKWRVSDIALPQPDGSFSHLYLPVQSWWENNDPKYRPGSLIGRQGSFDVMTCPDNTTISVLTLRRLTFTGPDGTEYELRDQATGGQPANNGACSYLNPPSRGKIFVTSDGSSATFVSDDTIYDYVISPNPEPEFFPSGYLMLRNGTRFRIEAGRVTWMRDRNGNKLNFGYDGNARIQSSTDSLNRVVSISRNTGPGTFDQITYKAFGGAPRFVKVNYSSLVNALRSDYPTTLTPKALFTELNGSSSSSHNPTVVSSIMLPNNQQYLIRYNPYGEIARVVLPTGGAVEYDYAGTILTGFEASLVIYRRVVERRVYPDGGTGTTYASRMTYSSSEAECAGCVKVDQFNNSGTLLTRTKHYFYGNAALSFSSGPTEYSGWKEGREYQTEEFASDGTTVLRRAMNTWQQPTAGNSWPLGQSETNDAAKTNNPQITQSLTTVEPTQANKVAKQTFAYDKYTNRTDVSEYDFGTGAAGSLVRRTHTDYLTSGYDTLNPSSSNPDLNLTSHIRSLPAQVSIFDAGGVERARSSTEYDNYVLEGADCLHSFHCPLLTRSNISGFDPLFTAAYTKRGNPTAVTRYLLSNGVVTSSIAAYSQYDIAGNVIRVLDPRSTLSSNIATTIEYDDRFGSPDNEARANSVPSELTGFSSFAFPTKITNALGHTSYAQFDYYLGQPVNGEDANGVVASGYFNDQLDRPTQIRRAVGTAAENQTTFSYDDFNHLMTASSDKDMNGDNVLVSKVLYDQMGRTIEARQYESTSNYIVTETQYDALGRAYKTSNPYRRWQSETAVWTTQAFDALGRVTSVTTPDNAVVGSSYNGNSTTVTDQAGKARKSVTDGLGRLIEVYEDPSGLNYQTSYLYDTLDNLVRVTQGSQQRFFMYDSLKRLIRARNPEQDTNSALNLSDPITNNSAWSIGYQYDVNGNLTSKTDARGVVTESYYDSLNRVTTTLYRVNGLPDPNTGDIEYLYDNATNGKGRLWLTYRWGSKPSHTAVGQYDAMGRVKQLYNLFADGQGGWSLGYESYRDYNLAGNVALQRYPSGRTVTYSYDTAGRTTSLSGNLGDGSNRTYASGISYTASGQMKQEQFGTNTAIYNKLAYNSRQQLSEILVSSGSDATSWDRGKILNQYSLQCSGAGCNATDNNGNLRKQEVYIPVNGQTPAANWYQQYDYDELNRLKRVHEYTGNTQVDWQQEYLYDRWGNRLIDTNATKTWGIGINNKSFEKQDSTNRLYSPGDLNLADNLRRIRFDAAGNQFKDTYTGYGTATFDGDNHIVAIADNSGGTSYYTYNAYGQRVRRKIGTAETWQIYGIDGELVSEYAANGAAGSPQKEYGYRNGQLLITAEPPVSPSNVALATNGSTVSASSTRVTPPYSYPVTAVSDGDRKGLNAGYTGNWHSSTATFPQWVQVDFNGSKTISEVDVFSLQDNYPNPIEPTETTTFTLYGLTGFDIQYWTGNAWATVSGGSVTGNNKVWKKVTFAPLTTSKIRVLINATADGWSRMVELEAWTSSTANINWLVTDHLGTPRMIVDQTGSLANVKRHDYLPFGEELFAGTGLRTVGLGYTSSDGIRQRFTQQERDIETGLDYFNARYYGSVQGRFTSADDFLNDTHPVEPASWNLYSYVRNNPLGYIDPNGEKIYVGDITNAADRDELLRRANYTYGCQGCVTVDKDGFLAVDTTGLSQDVVKATGFLTDAINSNDPKELFSVETTRNSSDVAFGDSQIGMAAVQLPGNKFKTSAIRIRLDFGDDKHVTGDNGAKEVFLNFVFAHEVSHYSPNHIRDPANGKTGPVVDAINEIQQARGLLLRAEYGATNRSPGGQFVSLTFGTAKRDRNGNIVRNKAGGIEVNKTDKVISWVKWTVGGKGNP